MTSELNVIPAPRRLERAGGSGPFSGHVRTGVDSSLAAEAYRLTGTPHAANIIGAQANLWTEVAENRGRVDYQAFPRLVAFAEVAWSQLPGPDERDFEHRMNTAHYARLDALGVGYRPPTGPHPWQRRPGVPGRMHDKPQKTWRMAD